jgi:predicted deacetylase
MWFGINDYQAEWVMKERVRDALREADKMRLIRAATSTREPRERWRIVTSALRRLRAIVTDPRAGDPDCQSPSTAVGSTCTCPTP